MKFVEFVHPKGRDAAHIAEARVTTTERLFLREHALTFPALNDQPNVHRPERILIGAREIWNIVALELEGKALSLVGEMAHADVLEAQRLCHIIRDAVLRGRFHYHGIG